MNTLIIASLALLFVHVSVLPLSFSLKHSQWLLGARDDALDLGVLALRAKRASANYLESLPAFLGLMLLAKLDGVDLADLGLYWLASRAVYAAVYIAGTPFVRTVVWMVSLVVLVMMAMALL